MHENGRVAEWFKAAVLKTAECNSSVSSNLTSSAIQTRIRRLALNADRLFFGVDFDVRVRLPDEHVVSGNQVRQQ